jgi:hypothetical protein
MRLENRYQAPSRKCLARGGKSSREFRRVVRVVIDNSHPRKLAQSLEAPADPPELAQGLQRRLQSST